MKKFRLQPILEYRKSLEEQVQYELFSIQNRLLKEMNELSTIKKQITVSQQELQKKQEGTICPAAIELHRMYIHTLKKRQIRQQEQVQSLEIQKKEKFQELLQATKEKKIIERLKDKTEAFWQKTLLQKEQKTLDERAGGQYFMKKEK